jgi:hypothetical protein
MKPESSTSCSQEPATGTDPESHKSSPHTQTLFLIDPFKHDPPNYNSPNSSLSLRISDQYSVRIFYIPHA